MATDGSELSSLAGAIPGPREHLTLGEAIAADIEARILRGELSKGQRLPTEPELGKALGVSRSVVRDAVRTLAARGLVTVRQGRGMVVSAPSHEAFGNALISLLMRSNLTMGDVIEARAALEIQFAPVAARNGRPENWREMQLHLDDFSAAVVAHDWERAYSEHMRFHLGLFQAVRIPALELLLRPVQQYILITSLPPRPDDPEVWEVDSHPPILAALRRGDEAEVREAMRRHFDFMKRDAYTEFRATPFRTGAALEALRALRSDPSQP